MIKRSFVPCAVAISALFSACASEPEPAEALQPGALRAAQQRGASELGCPAATAALISKETIPEPQGTGWYEPPHRAEFTVGVTACGKHTTYAVACDDRKKGCVAGPLSAPSAPPPDLADTLQPDAVKVAQQQGSSELGCPAATAQVLRKETIQEPQGTGWYEPPHRAVYSMDVSGCGKRTSYLVACDDRKSACVAGGLQKSPEGSPGQPQLADELQPGAVTAAQQRGTSELGCPGGATTEVRRKETLEEPQTTGWYESPHRAVYIIDVAGCGKRTSYLVACNDLKGKTSCTVGSVQSAARE